MPVVSHLEPWPSPDELASLRGAVLAHAASVGCPSSGADEADGAVHVVVAPYRACPLGAHVDHQGGVVTGMALNCGLTLGFVLAPEDPSDDEDESADEGTASASSRAHQAARERVRSTTVCLVSDGFGGEVRFDLGDVPPPGHEAPGEEGNWGAYARGAAWALGAWLSVRDARQIDRWG